MLKTYLKPIIWTISGLLIITPATLWANDNHSDKLDVKVIVFTHVSKKALNSQNYQNLLTKPNIDQAVSLQKQPQQTDNSLLSWDHHTVDTHPDYKPLPTDTKVFNNLQRRIKENGYRVVIKQHWQQPRTKQGQWVHLFGGITFDRQGQVKNYNNTPDTAYKDSAFWQMDGKIRINHYRFYQAQAKFYLTRRDHNLGINPDTTPVVPLQSYALEQKHATHLGKWLYLDHPLFGILVKVSSYQPTHS